MRYIITAAIVVTVLSIQVSMSKKRNALFMFILPIVSIIAGVIYSMNTSNTVDLGTLTPFLIVAAALLLSGGIRRMENRKNELKHMKSQDL